MQTNFLVIGSGISGLNFALNAAKKGNVLIVTKKKIADSSTNYAQGGIAAVLDKTDDFQEHIKDTLEAGAFHNNKKAVEFVIKNAPEAIHHLMELGVEFAKTNNKLNLTKEAGHSHNRIAYVGDYTGQEIEKILVKRVKENPNITIMENTFALDLIVKNKKCYGALVVKNKKIEKVFANQTILATGGIGQLFLHTTNPSISTGDGIAMGIRAGLKTKDMEFIQFHPTALAIKRSPLFLLSETLRGEGAKILNHKGKQFIKHPKAELAARDIVAREIYQEQKNGPVYLDISHKSKKYLEKRFPKIYQELKKCGFDLSKDKIPVTPAAHYICGGLTVNTRGQTNIKNLYAFGEVACTGVHGANRLASNSLLEALVLSNQIIEQLKPEKMKSLKINSPRISISNKKEIAKNRKIKKELKEIMWQYAGIVRNLNPIKGEAIPHLEKILAELNSFRGTNQETAETKNMTEVSLEILKSISKNPKSIGCHFVRHETKPTLSFPASFPDQPAVIFQQCH